MRLQLERRGGLTLINDAYNANPTSVHAALATLDALQVAGRKVVLLGDMHELGAQAERCHTDIGRAIGRSTAQIVIAVGRYARAVADGATISTHRDKRRGP